MHNGASVVGDILIIHRDFMHNCVSVVSDST